MKPAVPKIRVGDVLYGTRNLRNYLRTCSLLRYFHTLTSGYRNPKTADMLYTPRKDDQFVVAVNAHGRFCVWSANKDVALMFQNGKIGRERMSAQIFAQWFTRTGIARPDLQSWPMWAHYLWASLHMNACKNQNGALHFSFAYPEDNAIEFSAPFNLHEYIPGGIDRTTIKHAAEEAIRCGGFRNRGVQEVTLFGISGGGPDLARLPKLREDLRAAMRDPRIVSQTRKDSEEAYQFLMNVQKNPL